MLLPLKGIAHVSSITHEGKIVVVATDFDGKLWYTVRRDGFEKSEQPSTPGQLAETPENWEPFAAIQLPDEDNDASVVERERENHARIRSVYRAGASAVAPVQLVSGMGHLYIFRQSRANTLCVDRFVLDGLANKLVRKLEVRYKRSRKRYEPEQPAKDGGRIVFDTLDFRDRDGNPFYEPTTELALVAGLTDGWFSVVLLPTDELDRHRWHTFAHNTATNQVELISIAASEEGLFDLRDGRVAGIIRRKLDLGAPPAGGPAATKYDVQREVQTQAGKQWLRSATRVMLAVPTASGTVAVDFAAALDGTLAQISSQQSTPSAAPGKSTAVLLAPNTLEKIRAYGAMHPAASGAITGVARSDDDQVELELQRTHGDPLSHGAQIELGAGQRIDGTYVAHPVEIARTREAVNGAAIDRLPTSPLGERLARGTQLIVNGGASGSIVVLSSRADAGVTVLQIQGAAVSAPAGTPIAFADTGLTIGTVALDVNDAEQKMLPLASGLARALDPGTRLVVGGGARPSTLVTLAADAPAQSTEVRIEPVALSASANATLVRTDAFDIDLQRDALGSWKEVVDDSAGVVADGMVTHISAEAGGRLRVHAINHGLAAGDQVRISGSADYLGTWPVERIDDDHFRIDARWQGGLATNLRLERARRRALTFDGNGDYIADPTYRLRNADATTGRTHELWFRTTQARGTLLLFEVDVPAGAGDALTEDALIGLSSNSQGRSWIAAGYGPALVSVEANLADGQWHHVAHTFGNAAQGQALYVDGKLIARGASTDTLPDDYPGTLLIGAARRNQVLAGFRGEIADVRVWTRVRTPEEIASAMYGPLLGRESALARYWPMGAIVEGTPRTVVDLSPLRRDAIVHGDVFATPVTLRSTLADGTTSVIAFGNDSLVAVAAGVRYQERFEFRIKNGADEVIRDPQQAEGLFVFRYKGKRSHSAEDWITLPETPDASGRVAARTFPFSGPNEAGWFEAIGEFKLAADAELVLMRTFGIAQLQADRFETLEIRGHGLRAIEAGITEDEYADVVTLPASDPNADPMAARAYQSFEQREPTLIAERDHWQTLLDLYNDGAGSRAREAALLKEIDAAQRAERAAFAEYRTELHDPTNYWCWISHPAHNDATLAAIYFPTMATNTGWLGLAMLSGKRDDGGPVNHRLWAFLPDGSGQFRITTQAQRDNGVLLLGDTGVLLDRHVLRADLESRRVYTQWRKVAANSNGRYELVLAASDLGLSARGDGVTKEMREASPAREWTLTPTGEQATTRIPEAQLRHQSANQILIAKRAELSALQSAMRDGAAKAAQWRLYRDAADTSLTLVHAEMRRYGDQVLQGAAAAVSMRALTPNESRGLETRAARLRFIDAASRMTISETADGNVQLAYFDRDGRMRLTRYDAAATTGNTSHEQWLPDEARGCMEFGAGAALTLSPAIELPSEYTIEAWFQTPLPKTAEWNTLLRGSGGGEHHVLARRGRELGIYLAGADAFCGCGYDLSLMQPGWHHLAAVAHSAEQGASTTFYIDGVRAGDVMQTAIEAMRAAVHADTAIKDKAIEFDKRLKALHKKTFRASIPIDTIGNALARTSPANTQHFGRVAELRVWNLALSDEEIEINSKTALSGDEPGLLAWYPLDRDLENQLGTGSAVNVDNRAMRQVCSAPIGHPGHGVVRFDGSGDVLHVPADLKLPDVGTIELWVKTGMPQHAGSDLDGSTAWQSVLSFTDGRVSQIRLDTRLTYFSGSTIAREWRIAVAGGPASTPEIVWTSNMFDHSAWFHETLAWDLGQRTLDTFTNGVLVHTLELAPTHKPVLSRLVLGEATSGTSHFNGWVAELRLWSVRRSADAIGATLRRRLRGDEPGLIGYWPLALAQPAPAQMPQGSDTAARPLHTPNLTNPAQPATLLNATVVLDNTLPLVADALVTNEYVTYGIDFASGNKTAMMRRSLAVPAAAGVSLLAQKRVEQLELKWVGNAQFKPTLLGYIEGAPPVPSENLTVDPPSYNGAASVELEVANEVRYGWSREQDAGLGLSLAAFFGTEGEYGAVTPLGVTKKLGEFKVGFKGELDFTYGFLNSTKVETSSSSTTLDRMELRGAPEDEPRFPTIGRRFVPKNVGYALVVSALADVFVTRLKRTGRMVSYALKPVEGIPPDVNTVTFLINPAYIMNGSLDGLTGLKPTSERFFGDVSQMRAQYGAVYPASYYRLYDAYDLAAKIDQADTERATYFANFNARLVDETSLNREVDPDVDDDESRKAAAEEQTENLKASRTRYEQGVHSAQVFESWQRKMEDLQIRAGKRNIVNTYVWDADGGTHAESQQFASTVEHTIGSSIEFSGKLGVESEVNVADVKGELTALATFHVTQTMTKSVSTTQALSLNVDLSGVERQSVTDFKDRPYFPGEKVKRYRFMSFYLEGATSHFDDFFAQVVDPEWLAGNNEGARALREVDRAKKNKTWRVMHRVTYVERPVLAGFGRDTRQIAGSNFYTELGPLQESVARLEAENKLLQGKLDTVLELIRRS